MSKEMGIDLGKIEEVSQSSGHGAQYGEKETEWWLEAKSGHQRHKTKVQRQRTVDRALKEFPGMKGWARRAVMKAAGAGQGWERWGLEDRQA